MQTYKRSKVTKWSTLLCSCWSKLLENTPCRIHFNQLFDSNFVEKNIKSILPRGEEGKHLVMLNFGELGVCGFVDVYNVVLGVREVNILFYFLHQDKICTKKTPKFIINICISTNAPSSLKLDCGYLLST